MPFVPCHRIDVRIDVPVRAEGAFVLYWMIAARRTRSNYGLQQAVAYARDLRRPLLVLEAVQCNYPWASDRHHQFIIDGMSDNARRFGRRGIHYYPYVEPAPSSGRGLLAALGKSACVIITDMFPAFVVPRFLTAAGRIGRRLEVIDSNGLLPLSASDRDYPTAYAFRRYLQTVLPDHLSEAPTPDPLRGIRLPAFDVPLQDIERRWPPWPLSGGRERDTHLSALPIDHAVPATPLHGGERCARARLADFVESRLEQYGQDRSLDIETTSGLSPYLHFGHISSHDILAAVMEHEEWSLQHVFPKANGRRSGWWGVSEAAESFLDQLITWRELGFHTCAYRDGYDQYDALPDWAQATLNAHRKDPRPHVYSSVEFEFAQTHDPLWNAAQRQLVRDGRIHNYLRMLWGKKILEWTPSPETALDVMIELNNKYALDGRDPNSYSGIFWCLGRYDRPWGPEREVFGTIRYMSSQNTARKMKVTSYLERYAD